MELAIDPNIHFDNSTITYIVIEPNVATQRIQDLEIEFAGEQQ